MTSSSRQFLEEAEPCEDAISRQAVDHLCFEFLKANTDDNIAFYEHFRDLPPVKPVACIAKVNFSKEDMQEIVDKSIEKMVVSNKEKWIPMVRREPTDEEKAEYLAQNGEELFYMLENEMPLNGQEVLVSIGEFVSEDVFDEDFYNFENNDIENVDAWMPLPKPYREVKE